ncbi:tatB, partial [Symbiodinium sp. CCMP2456]
DKAAAPDQDGETQQELDEKIAKSRAAASDLWYNPEDAPDYDSWDVPKDAKAFLRRLDERLEDIEALGSELKTVQGAAARLEELRRGVLEDRQAIREIVSREAAEKDDVLQKAEQQA